MTAEPFTLHLGDCIEVMRGLGDNSVDAIVTDPPYELGFMGKDWDASGIANNPAMWAEALRVLKPGGHLLAFSGSRTYHRMTCAIEDAGFEIRDQIMWVYGSGFPKSLDVSKAIDKAAGAERELVGRKHIGMGNRKGDGFRHAGDTSGVPVTAPATDAARQWDGWGTALKPAHEPICVARKPFAGTVAANVLTFGTGALNIEACRIQADDASGESQGRSRDGEASAVRSYATDGSTNFAMKPGPRGGDAAGRWPANLIHDGSAEVVEHFPANAGQAAPLKTRNSDKTRNSFGTFTGTPDADFAPHDGLGSAARFFYSPKASRRDRNEGCEHLAKRPLHWSSGDANPGSFQGDGTDRTSENNHPTVKPTDLMAYLCRLVTPPGGLVLDPFMGSGSTGKAAMREGFRFVGIDLTPEYVEIARARIQHELARIEAERAAVPPPSPQLDLFAMETAA